MPSSSALGRPDDEKRLPLAPALSPAIEEKAARPALDDPLSNRPQMVPQELDKIESAPGNAALSPVLGTIPPARRAG